VKGRSGVWFGATAPLDCRDAAGSRRLRRPDAPHGFADFAEQFYAIVVNCLAVSMSADYPADETRGRRDNRRQ